MKKYFSRVMAFGLSLACAISMVPVAFASNETVHYSATELLQIEAEREDLNEFLRMQLEAQDALEYIDEFSYLVDYTINTKYYPQTRSKGVEAENGGFAFGYDIYYQREAEFCNVQQTATLYQSANATPEVLYGILGNIGMGIKWENFKNEIIKQVAPGLSSLFTAVTWAQYCNELNNAAMWGKITIGVDGCIANTLKDRVDMKEIYVVWPWDEMPYIDTSIFPDTENVIVKTREEMEDSTS